MNSQTTRSLTLLALICSMVFAANGASPQHPVILVGVPVNAAANQAERDAWFAGLSEQVLHYRLSASSAIEVAPSAQVHGWASLQNKSAPLDESQYRELAAKVSATHLLLQSYEIRRDGKSVHCYLDFIPLEPGAKMTSRETDFSMDNLTDGLDSLALWVYASLHVGLDKDLSRFFGIPAAPATPKDLKAVGAAAAAGASAPEALANAQACLQLAEKDSRNLLAQYVAAQLFARAKEPAKAAQISKDLLAVLPGHCALYVDICTNLRLCGRYVEALSFAASAEGRKVQSTALLLEGALCLESLGKLQKAQKAFEAVLAKIPDQPDALLFFARTASRNAQYKEAMQFAQKVLAKEKDNGAAYLELGRSLLLLSRTDEAIAALEKCAQLIPTELSAHRLLADAYAGRKEYEKAARQYDAFLQFSPSAYDVLLKSAQCWEQAGKLQDALAILERAERLFGDSIDVQRKIGLLENRAGTIPSAILHLEQYVEKGRGDAEVFMTLGDIYTSTGKFDRAFYLYNHAMPLVTDKNPCRFALASFYMKQSNPNAAIPYLLDIVKEEPAYPRAHRLLADAWFSVGTKSEALNSYLKSRALDGDDPRVQQRIADILFDSGNLSQAEKEYEKLAQLDSTGAQAYYRLAIISLNDKNETKAQEYLRTALARSKPDAATLYLLGCGYDQAADTRKALDAYAQCAALEPKNEQALVKLAADYCKADDNRSAAESHMKLYDLDNDKNQEHLATAGMLFEKANIIDKAHDAYALFVSKGYVSPQVNLHLARFEFDIHNYERTLTLITQLDAKLLGDDQTIRMLAESYFKMNNFAQAEPWLERLCSRQISAVEPLDMLATAYEKNGRFEKARHACGQLISIAGPAAAPDYAFRIGGLFEKNNLTDQAMGRYRQNIASYPDDMRNYDRLSSLLIDAKDYAGGRAVLESALARPAAPAVMMKTLAEVCLAQNDRVAAVRTFKDYLAKAPADFDAWKSLGDIYFEKELFAKAAEVYQRAVQIKPQDFTAQFSLARSFRKLAQNDSAVAAAKQARSIQPENADVLFLLADCYRAAVKKAELTDVLQKIAEIQPSNFDVRAELGGLLVAAGKVSEGVSVYEAASTMHPKDPKIHILLARGYEILNNANARYSHLRLAQSASPGDPEVYFELGRFLVDKQSTAKAQMAFEKALELDSNYTQAMYEYSKLLVGTGNRQAAFDLMSRAVKQESYSAPYLVLFARLAWDLDKRDLAEGTVNTALSLDSTSVAAQSLAGYIYKELGKTPQAKEILSRAIAQDSKCADCYRYLGDISFDEYQYIKAAGYFHRAIEIGDSSEALAVQLGRALHLGCQDDKAREVFEQVLAKNPAQPEAFYRLTNLYIRAGQVDMARELVEKRAKDEKTVWHHLAAGEMSEMDGKMDEALISYTVALHLNPNLADAHAGCGRIDLYKQDYNSAIVNFGKALARDPYNPYMLLDLAKAYEGIGEYPSASEIYTEVSTKYPQVAEAYYRFAQLESRSNEHRRAIEIIEQGLSHNPKSARLYMGLGNAQRMLGNFTDAIAAYEEAIKKDEKQCLDAYLSIANIYSKNLNMDRESQKYVKKYLRAGGQQDEVKKQMAALDAPK